MRRKQDWIDRMTVQEARDFMDKEIEIKTSGTGKRAKVELVNPISFRDLDRIKQKAMG